METNLNPDALANATSVFALLAATGGVFDANAMRPYIDPADGRTKIVVNQGGNVGTLVVNAPAALPYDAWKDIDREMIRVTEERLIAVNDLISRGLTHSTGGVGNTTSQQDRESDITPAQADMMGVSAGEEDTVNYDTVITPIPVIHKDFRLNWRRLAASRSTGEALDMSMPSKAMRKVSELSESMIFNGLPSISVDGASVFGYLTHADRNTLNMANVWTSATPEQIVDDVKAMAQAARNDGYYGPYVVYIPGAYETVLDDDYVVGTVAQGLTSVSRTVRDRILAVSGVAEIKVADMLTGNNVLLIQMSRDVVDLAIGQDMTTVQWEVMGGLQQRFKTMAVWAPRIKSDYDGKSGIVHLRPNP